MGVAENRSRSFCPSNTSSAYRDDKTPKKKLATGAIAGIVVGAATTLALLATVFIINQQ